jgi:uncharacterized protein (TIGR02569 family)
MAGYDARVSAQGEPPDRVFAAFGVGGVAREKLDGGRGLTWRAGPVVVRPTGGGEEADWRAGVLEFLECDREFRVPRPIRAVSGRWVVDGWEAWQWVPGAADERRVSDVVRAGDAFHRAIAGLERPTFIDTSDDPWARADRMAWEEEPLPADPMLERLAAEFRRVESPSQLIHGDLLGNVLFAEGMPATIIDWAPYWRPAGLGAAIAVVDAFCWHGVPIESVPGLGQGVAEWEQLLVRALTFRMATLHLLGVWDSALAERHAPVADVIVALAVAAGNVQRMAR